MEFKADSAYQVVIGGEPSQGSNGKGAVMFLTNLLVPIYRQMLKTLPGWLDKAQAQMPEGRAEAALLH